MKEKKLRIFVAEIRLTMNELASRIHQKKKREKISSDLSFVARQNRSFFVSFLRQHFNKRRKGTEMSAYRSNKCVDFICVAFLLVSIRANVKFVAFFPYKSLLS